MKSRTAVSFPSITNGKATANTNTKIANINLVKSEKELEYDALMPQAQKCDTHISFPCMPAYKSTTHKDNITNLANYKHKNCLKKEDYENYSNNTINDIDHDDDDDDDDDDGAYKAAMDLLHTYAYRRKVLTAATQVAQRMKENANLIAEWAEQSQLRTIAQPINVSNNNNNNNKSNRDSDHTSAKSNTTSDYESAERKAQSDSANTFEVNEEGEDSADAKQTRAQNRHSVHDALHLSLDEGNMDRVTEQLMREQNVENEAARGIALETHTDEEIIATQINDKVERLRRIRDLQRAIVELDDEIDEQRQELEQLNDGEEQWEYSQAQYTNKSENNSGMYNNKDGNNNKELLSDAWHGSDSAKLTLQPSPKDTMKRSLKYSIDTKLRTVSEMKMQLRALLREEDHNHDMRPPTPPNTFSSNALATTLEYMSTSLHELVASTDKICVATVFKTRDEVLSLTPLLHRMQLHASYLERCFDVAYSHSTHFENGERALVEGGSFEVNSLRDRFLVRKKTLTAQEQREKIAEESQNNLLARLRHLRRRCDMWEELFFHRSHFSRSCSETDHIISDVNVADHHHQQNNNNNNNYNFVSNNNNKYSIDFSNVKYEDERENESMFNKQSYTDQSHSYRTTRTKTLTSKKEYVNSPNLPTLQEVAQHEEREQKERTCKMHNHKFAATSPSSLSCQEKQLTPLEIHNEQRNDLNSKNAKSSYECYRDNENNNKNNNNINKNNPNHDVNLRTLSSHMQSTQPFLSTEVYLNNIPWEQERELEHLSSKDNAMRALNTNVYTLDDVIDSELERQIADQWGNPYVKCWSNKILPLSNKTLPHRQSFIISRSRRDTCASLVDDKHSTHKTNSFRSINSSTQIGSEAYKAELHRVSNKENMLDKQQPNSEQWKHKPSNKDEELLTKTRPPLFASSSPCSSTTNVPLSLPSNSPQLINTEKSHTNHIMSVNNDENHVESISSEIDNTWQENDKSFLYEISFETKTVAEARALSLLQNLLHILPVRRAVSSTHKKEICNKPTSNQIEYPSTNNNAINQNAQVCDDVDNDDINSNNNNNANNDNARASVQRLIRYLL